MSGILERYEHAAQAEIVVTADHRTSADYLLAAGMAQAGDARNQVAVALYRLRLSRCAAGMGLVRAWAVASLQRQFQRGHSVVRNRAAGEIVDLVLHWYLEGVCPSCQGRKRALIPGTQLVSANACHTCAGLGKEPVVHRLPRRYHAPGRWLADELGNLMSFVVSDMDVRLRG